MQSTAASIRFCSQSMPVGLRGMGTTISAFIRFSIGQDTNQQSFADTRAGLSTAAGRSCQFVAKYDADRDLTVTADNGINSKRRPR
ncbi:hypothetical protein [Tateyamaria sp. syn59]|uniref:hypothetical protein n=1 Tax=Tateyamaria sp. syn59 TaxID=2576942 RepID=UPI0011BFE383|nr:hypothetical protein [Tateyamaria sp. syn59]